MARLNRKYQEELYELGLEQAIINHKEAVLQSNMAMQKLRDETNASLKDMKQSLVRVTQKVQDDALRYDELMSQFVQYFDDIFSRFRQIPLSIDKEAEKIKELMDKKDSYYLRMDEFEAFISKVDGWIAAIRSAFERQKEVIDHKAQEIKKDIEARLAGLTCDIHDKIREKSKAIDEINNFLDRQAVDYSGLKEDIEFLKKRVFILEKHDENLYTQIKRMKGEDS